jgi:aminopeptidase N
MRIPTLLIALALFFAVGQAGAASCVLDPVAREFPEKRSWIGVAKGTRHEVPRGRTDRPIDVLLYELDLNMTPNSTNLNGAVEIEFTTLEAMDFVEFDLSNLDLTVSACWIDGASANFLHENELLRIDLPAGTTADTTFRARIEYGGRPSTLRYGLPSFSGGLRSTILADADGFPDPGAPILASLSEPTAARAWWPCHDTPFDAAQARLRVTAPEGYTLVAPGIREEMTDLGDGRWRQTWFMSTPIPAYLVSLVLADLSSWTETATVTSLADGQPVSMPVEFYVNDALYDTAQFSWQNTTEMVEYFDQTISPYPYGDIKYGHAIFPFSGGMEHPTLTSMGQLTATGSTSSLHGGPQADWIIAHELFHQWFGDSLRLQSWGEIWLNEGFASYGEVLWLEHEYGYDIAKQWLTNSKRRESFPGTIRNPSVEVGLFSATVYQKGAWTLHMLRQVLGSADFIETLRRYADRYRFEAVNSDLFQAVCEEVHAESGGAQLVGGSLDWFFRDWLEREGRPDLALEWWQSDAGLAVTVQQAEGQNYRLPLILRIGYADGSVEDRDIVIDGPVWESLLAAPQDVESLELDPEDDWLLRKSQRRLVGDVRAALLPLHPNPFNPSVTVRFFLSSPRRASLDVYDVRGRHVRRIFDGPQPEGIVELEWDGIDADGHALGSGVYLFVLEDAAGGKYARRATLLK